MVCNTVYIMLPILTQLWQGCVCLFAPYPNNPDPAGQFDFATDMDLSGEGLLWYARPQLFFNCTVASTGRLCDTASHRQLALVFFSTFEPINLPIDSVMKREGVPMFFDSASSTNLPSLYLCRAENVLGRVPLMPCFVGGNSTPTLPHQFGNRQGALASANTSVGRGNGSRLYELNLWMWRYGRGQPRHVTVEESEKRRKERTKDARRRAAETLKRRREEPVPADDDSAD